MATPLSPSNRGYFVASDDDGPPPPQPVVAVVAVAAAVSVNPQTVEDLLVQEMAQLSLRDKLDLEDEIHGFFSKAVHETPELVQEHLHRFQLELDGENNMIPFRDKQAYLQAGRIMQGLVSWAAAANNNDDDPSNSGPAASSSTIAPTQPPQQQPPQLVLHVLQDEYKLRFLRAELFDVPKAAVRYCKWLDMLVDLYGPIALTRPLYLRDLKTDDDDDDDDDDDGDDHANCSSISPYDALKEGVIQALPTRDRSGRRVVTLQGHLGLKFPARVKAKCLCYVLDVVTLDDTTQKDGLVVIIQTSLDIRDSLASPTHQREDVRIVEALPARLTGFHIAHPSESCHNSDGTTTTGSTVDSGINITRRRIVQALLLIIMGEKLRRVTRVHDGSPTENEYSLKHEYGVPTKDIPLTCTNNIKLAHWKHWMAVREDIDAYHNHHYFKHAPVGRFLSSSSSATSLMRSSSRKIVFQMPPMPLPPPKMPLDCPDMATIVFRRGGSMWDHPPNKVLRSILVLKEQEREMAVCNMERRKVVTDIIQELRDLGFGFCHWDKSLEWYAEFDESVEGEQALRTCVNSALKDNIKRAKARRKIQEQQSEPQSHHSQQPPDTCCITFVNQDHHHDSRSNEITTFGEQQIGGSYPCGRKRKGTC